jgi:hypothetical protein
MDLESNAVAAEDARTAREGTRSRDCEAAQAGIDRFLAGKSTLAEDRVLHEHLARCEPCRSEYKAALDPSGPSDELASLRGRFAAASVHRTRRRSRLLKVLIPAIVIAAILVQLGPERPAGEVVAIDGQCLVGDEKVLSGEPAKVPAGQWLSTEENSLARMEFRGGSSILISQATRLWIDESGESQLHLALGEISAQGTCTVTTTLGAIEIERGSARIAMREHGLEVQSFGGGVVLCDASGEKRLVAGEIARREERPQVEEE